MPPKFNPLFVDVAVALLLETTGLAVKTEGFE
jgi:hypothetical protein